MLSYLRRMWMILRSARATCERRTILSQLVRVCSGHGDDGLGGGRDDSGGW